MCCLACRWCDAEFYPKELTIDGFCSAECERECYKLNTKGNKEVKG